MRTLASLPRATILLLAALSGCKRPPAAIAAVLDGAVAADASSPITSRFAVAISGEACELPAVSVLDDGETFVHVAPSRAVKPERNRKGSPPESTAALHWLRAGRVDLASSTWGRAVSGRWPADAWVEYGIATDAPVHSRTNFAAFVGTDDRWRSANLRTWWWTKVAGCGCCAYGEEAPLASLPWLDGSRLFPISDAAVTGDVVAPGFRIVGKPGRSAPSSPALRSSKNGRWHAFPSGEIVMSDAANDRLTMMRWAPPNALTRVDRPLPKSELEPMAVRMAVASASEAWVAVSVLVEADGGSRPTWQLFRFDGRKAEAIPLPPIENVEAMFVDREGSLWVANVTEDQATEEGWRTVEGSVWRRGLEGAWHKQALPATVSSVAGAQGAWATAAGEVWRRVDDREWLREPLPSASMHAVRTFPGEGETAWIVAKEGTRSALLTLGPVREPMTCQEAWNRTPRADENAPLPALPAPIERRCKD